MYLREVVTPMISVNKPYYHHYLNHHIYIYICVIKLVTFDPYIQRC